MARDILKVRKVGGTLVVTLTQGVLEQVPLIEGDRVLIEALPPRRILISKEATNMPSTRRLELEIGVLEAKRESFNLQISAEIAAFKINDMGAGSEWLDSQIKTIEADRGKVEVSLAEKKLEMFDLQGI